MLKLTDTLYFASISPNYQNSTFWNSINKEISSFDGRWYLKIAERLNPSRFVTRDGEWSLPWPQELIPGFEMPKYDPYFNKSFETITDEQAIVIKNRINAGEKFAVMYSGGIDSTVVLAALIKNLTTEELTKIVVCASGDSVIENPYFWKKFVNNKLTVLDSKQHKYDDLIEKGYIPITADEGDCLFGTLIGLILYNNFDYMVSKLGPDARLKLSNLKYKISDPEIHYSEFKDLIIAHLDSSWDQRFGRILYEKYVRNIETASVPIHSLHDFFWWLIFNVKYLNCSVRGALYYNDRIEYKTAINTIVNWFNAADYQRWSMVNNNNGLKIRSTPISYKNVAKDYIYDVDGNEWYRTFKTKIESMWTIGNPQPVQHLDVNRRPNARIALTKDYKMIHTNDIGAREYFLHHLSNYKIDWTDIT
jgi:hypothetical protein